MSRFDQCTETCTTDCGHCKGRPVEALRYELARTKAKLTKALDLAESAQKIAAQLICQRDEAQSLADMMGANVDALEAEVARLTVERDAARLYYGEALTDRVEIERLALRQQPVIEAAKVWRDQFSKSSWKAPRAEALIAAVDALESTEGEYECMLVGCGFVGTKPQCREHEAANPSHDQFGSVPSWEELAGGAVTPDVQVWISTAKNGISYHAIAPLGRYTVCGRYVGRDGQGPQRGHVLPLAEVVDRFGSRPCRQCTGDMERAKPIIRPSRDASWT